MCKTCTRIAATAATRAELPCLIRTLSSLKSYLKQTYRKEASESERVVSN